MNKILKGLLLTALAVSADQAQAATNQTFLMPRPVGVNLAMEYTTFNDLVHRKNNDKFGANFQVTGFYQASTDGSRVGKYFGLNNKNNITLAESKTVAPSNGVSTIPDLDLGYILHNEGGAYAGSSVVINFDPKQKAYGARLDYYQDLEKVVKGLYLTVALPVVHVENNMNMSINTACNASAAQTTLNQTVINYFKGQQVSLGGTTAAGNNVQAPLTKAKINGRRGETGVADIDVKLGYDFLHNDCYHVGLNLGVTFPTGNQAKGNYLFEPIVGNGQHWGLGFGLDSLFRLWNNEDSNLKFAVIFNYRYLFESHENRTLGINQNPTTPAPACPTRCGVARNWGQYYLLGNTATTAAPFALTPAANITTQSVNVTPGSQFDGIAAFTYNVGGFSFDLGYNLYLREREKVRQKSNCLLSNNTQYGVAARDFDTATGAHVFGAGIFGNTRADYDGGTSSAAAVTSVNSSTLNTCVAQTPSQVTNKLFVGLGYAPKEWDTPILFGLGGSYEWANKAALDQWSVWAKIGVGF